MIAVATPPSPPCPFTGAPSRANEELGLELAIMLFQICHMYDQHMYNKDETHFARAAASTGGIAPVPIIVLCPKLGTPASVTT